MQTDKDGNKYWHNSENKLHRIEKDPLTGHTLPAFIGIDGSQLWWFNGMLHRDDIDSITGLTLPAIIWKNRSKLWYKFDKLHRIDKDPKTGLTLPAIEFNGGSCAWYKDGVPHRNDKDPITQMTLPAYIGKMYMGIIRKEWWVNGFLYRNELKFPVIERWDRIYIYDAESIKI